MSDTPRNQQTDTRRMKAILVLAATIAFISAPIWSSGFGGFNPDDFPVRLENPGIQPAGYVFAIWGLIYLWLLVSAAFGLFARAEDSGWDGMRWWLAASLAIGTPWISVASVSPVWATVLIVAMLIPALLALRVTPPADKWMLRAPVALYAGWLSVATAVSFGVLLTGYGAPLWAWVVLPVAVLGAAWFQLGRAGAPLYGLAVAWGLGGIVVRNLSAGDAVPAMGAAVLVVAMIAAAVFSARRAE